MMDIYVNTLRSFVTFYFIFCAFIVLSVFLMFLCILLLLSSVIINDNLAKPNQFCKILDMHTLKQTTITDDINQSINQIFV